MNNLSKQFILVLLGGMLIFTTSCDPNQTSELTVPDKSMEVIDDMEDVLSFDLKSLNFVPTANLTADETAGLLYMREEEKLAQDIYSMMFNLYSLTIFDRISSSELQHTTKILELLTFYGIADPALVGIGLFTNPTLQQLYTDLITQGNLSVEDALGVGALIEEVDILDLISELNNTTNANLILVYSNLLNGSKNHLNAFVRTLDTYGITYTPQLMDTVLFNDIISSASAGNGSGNNSGGGSGTCTGTGNPGNNNGNGSGTCTGTGTGNSGNNSGTGNNNGGGSGTCTGTGTSTGSGNNGGGNSGNGNSGNGNSGGSSGGSGNNSGGNSGNGNSGNNSGGNSGNGNT